MAQRALPFDNDNIGTLILEGFNDGRFQLASAEL